MRTEKEINARYKKLLNEIEECEVCMSDCDAADIEKNPNTFESIKRNKRRLEQQKYVLEWILGIEDEF